MRKNSGSAIIVVLAIMVVLVVVVASVMQNRTNRANFTRYMSNEKKAEAIAEALVDATISKIREKCNDFETKDDIYLKLRESLSSSEGLKIDGLESYYESVISAFSPEDLNGTIDTHKVEAEIVKVESFADDDTPGEVVGVDIEANKSSNASNFPNSINPETNKWRLAFMYPYIDDASKTPMGSVITSAYSGGKTNKKVGIYNDGTFSNSLKEKFDGFDYASQWIDIDLEYTGDFKDVIDALLKVSGSEGLPNKTQASILLKKASGYSDSKTNVEFGVWLHEDMLEKINQIIKTAKQAVNPDEGEGLTGIGPLDWLIGTIEDAFVNLISGIQELFGADETLKEKFEKVSQLEEITPHKINEILKEKINSNDALKDYMDENSLNIEKIITKEVKTFKSHNLTKITTSEYLKKLNGGSSSNLSSWKEKTNNIGEIIEKGGLLQLTCKVEFTPNNGKKIQKKLVTQIPFKVSDTQPIAPEYSFFVANSSKLNEAGDAANVSNKIDLNAGEDPEFLFIVHNSNYAKNTPIDGRLNKYAPNSSETPPAGKIRINGEIEPMLTYSGGLDNEGFKYSELPAICLTNEENTKNQELQLKATFILTDKPPTSDDAPACSKIVAPTLTLNPEQGVHPTNGNGFKSIAEMFDPKDIGDIFSCPTLLYGLGHLDFPLGSSIEGNLAQRFSVLYAYMYPKLSLTADVGEDGLKISVTDDKPWDNEFKLFYGMEEIDSYPVNTGKKIPYGTPNVNNYGIQKQPNDTWSNTEDSANMPPYCYSNKQYRKKASRFYTKSSDLIDDFTIDIEKGGLYDNEKSKIRIDGVIYVDEELDLSANADFVGHGLIVAESIKISSDIKVADDSTLGLIARTGAIEADSKSIEAACFSNASPFLTSTTIKGNLVVNEFNRDNFKDVNIRYDSKKTTFANEEEMKTKRYFASFANNWSNSHYDNKYDD